MYNDLPFTIRWLVLKNPFHKYPELSVAAYNKNAAALNEPDGLVAIWNLHLLERPEFVFHSQVCAACCTDMEGTNVILVGCSVS